MTIGVSEIIDPAHSPRSLRVFPDWRNLGVVLRTLVLVNLAAVATAAVPVETLAQWWGEIGLLAVRVEFPLMLSLLALYVAMPVLVKLSEVAAWLVVLGLAWCAVSLWVILLDDAVGGPPVRALVWTAVVWGCTWAYFASRRARYSPALSEARLLALTARIRPHFFFNSLNGVLGIMRSDPGRAETALEELADLFRILMRDNRSLVTLGEEIALCGRYLDLEHLRLGDRLNVVWRDDNCPRDALLPPLTLQPLLENAVYHGIEPAQGRGQIEVSLVCRGGEVFVEVINGLPPPSVEAFASGNHLALDNLRERLMLFFDLEASLSTEKADGRFRVKIRLPYRKSSP